jgi:hypothetical protein
MTLTSLEASAFYRGMLIVVRRSKEIKMQQTPKSNITLLKHIYALCTFRDKYHNLIFT